MSKRGGCRGSYHYQCEWPTDCPFTAVSSMRRGENTNSIRVCTHHANQFICMTNAECADVAKRRHPERKTRVNNTPGFGAQIAGARY